MTRTARAGAAGALAAALLLVAARPARAQPAQTVLYTISIGQNEIPQALRNAQNEGLAPLRYADDDAAYFHTIAIGTGIGAVVLAGAGLGTLYW